MLTVFQSNVKMHRGKIQKPNDENILSSLQAPEASHNVPLLK